MKKSNVFNHPAAREILESKTSDAAKIKALHSLSGLFSNYVLSEYFGYTEKSIMNIISDPKLDSKRNLIKC